ncbi:YqcC family protein [Mergibacter septicus]|uniref:YqcC family protein n=1 Tax=Mergibacter septicus TaxID=221402 RepID=UPI003905E1C9
MINKRLLLLLEQLEATMQRLDIWQIDSPSFDALSSTQPFALDHLTATEWLQWIFIPKLRGLATQKQPLPSKIAVTPYLEEACKERDYLAELLPAVAAIETFLLSAFNSEDGV